MLGPETAHTAWQVDRFFCAWSTLLFSKSLRRCDGATGGGSRERVDGRADGLLIKCLTCMRTDIEERRCDGQCDVADHQRTSVRQSILAQGSIPRGQPIAVCLSLVTRLLRFNPVRSRSIQQLCSARSARTRTRNPARRGMAHGGHRAITSRPAFAAGYRGSSPLQCPSGLPRVYPSTDESRQASSLSVTHRSPSPAFQMRCLTALLRQLAGIGLAYQCAESVAIACRARLS